METGDEKLLDKYHIDTIFMDINHYTPLSNCNIFVCAGDPSWGLGDMQKVIEDAVKKKVDGVMFDIEGNYETLASNLSLLDSSVSAKY